MSAEDASRLKELSSQLSSENTALAKLRASCAGLQKKAAEIQASAGFSCRMFGLCNAIHPPIIDAPSHHQTLSLMPPSPT